MSNRRSKQWLKMKCELSEEFVVGGFTDPSGLRVWAWALCWLVITTGAEFCFAGKIGTGFDTKLLLELRARLDQLEIPKSLFTKSCWLAAYSSALGEAGSPSTGLDSSNGRDTEKLKAPEVVGTRELKVIRRLIHRLHRLKNS
jgi:hypothetical protein